MMRHDRPRSIRTEQVHAHIERSATRGEITHRGWSAGHGQGPKLLEMARRKVGVRAPALEVTMMAAERPVPRGDFDNGGAYRIAELEEGTRLSQRLPRMRLEISRMVSWP